MIATATRRQGGRRAARTQSAGDKSESLLDVVDCLLDRGLALDSEIVLGLADIDLVYLRVGAVLAAADRVFRPARAAARRSRPALNPAIAPPRRRGRLVQPSAEPSLPVRSSPSRAQASLAPSSPDDTSRSVMRLALTVVEFIRQLLERQAVRRVRERTLDAEEIERLGTALMRLESTVRDLAERYGLALSDLNLDLGPLGRLR
jgi:hypothetical protein